MNSNYKYKCLLWLLLCLAGAHCYAQKSEVSVSTLTGTANAVIPIYTINRGKVSLPISLTYSATGIKPTDVEGNAGMGWELQAGGQISRQVRGLPDDTKHDVSNNPRKGWIYNTMAANIAGYTINNTGDADCTGQQADITYINSNYNDTLDTEPDIFYVSAPGLSCKLVYDNAVSHKFVTIPYMDVKIAYTVDGQGIDGFTITNDQGIKYTFGWPETTKKWTVPFPGAGSSGTYLQRDYRQYQHAIIYYSTWMLSSMTDANGNGVQLTYTEDEDYPRLSSDKLTFYGGAPLSTTTTLNQYIIQQSVTQRMLLSLTAFDANGETSLMAFTWQGSPSNGTGQAVIRTIEGMGKGFSLQYAPVAYTSGASTYNRFFLTRFVDGGGCATPIDYKFDYYNVTKTGSDYTTTLADSTSTRNIDYWGYYTTAISESDPVPAVFVNPSNGSKQRYEIGVSTIGSDYSVFLGYAQRVADPDNVMAGSLKRINYAQGGSTILTYESNDYEEDPGTDLSVTLGGGIRIKQIKDSDNVASATIIRNYSYINPVTGISSGKPVSLPVYAFTTPYTGSATGTDYWNYSTIRSNTDLSMSDHSIMYEYVKESRPGAGSTQYQYALPATNWDTSASPSCSGCTTPDWAPTTVYNARPTCVSYGSPKNDFDTYPFAPNPNYDFERGLLLKMTTYNEASTPQKTSENAFTYQRTSTPGTIYGFRYDMNGPSGLQVMGYSKYLIYYGTSELSSTVTKTIYDSGTLSQAQTTASSYTYGSTYHKMATETANNSDGSTLTTNYTYAKDFTGLTSGNSNPNIDALYQLQQLNINNLVESYTTVQRGGGSPLVTSAALTMFGSFPTGVNTMYLPTQLYKFIQPNGGSSFSPLSISGTTLTKDSRYILEGNNIEYDFTGVVQTSDDAHKHVQAALIDHTAYQPIIAVKNAAAFNIAYNDFDSDLIPAWTGGFTGTLTGAQPPGSHTGLAKGMSNGQTFYYTIQKSDLGANYIYSVWINSPTGGSIDFTLAPVSPSTGSTVTVTKTFASTGAGSTWKYFQWKLPMPVMTSGATVKVTGALTCAANIAIDDMALYPEAADIATFAYDPTTFYKTAETNTNGLSAYFLNDQWGRLLLQLDQDKNIAMMKSYITPDLIANSAPVITVNTNGITLNPVILTDSARYYNTCTNVGTTYSWSIDGGAYSTPSLTDSLVTSFSTVGTHTAQLRVVSPYYGTQTTPVKNIPIVAPMVTIDYENNTIGDGSISSVTLSQGGVPVYTIPGASLNGATVAEGVYDITVVLLGGQGYDPFTGFGYGSVEVNGVCQNYDPGIHVHNTYTWNAVDLSSALTLPIWVFQASCP